jgi:hypothetical protein
MFSDSLVSWRLSFLAAPLASFMFRSRVSLHLEIIALRHQLAVVNRSRRPCLRLTPVDRMLWAWLSRSWCGWRSGIHRQAGNRPCVASARLSRVLDLEKPTSLWPASGLTRCPRVNSRDVYREADTPHSVAIARPTNAVLR